VDVLVWNEGRDRIDEESYTIFDILDFALGRAGVKGAGDAALAHGVRCHCADCRRGSK
jgi:hypothetical protein